ncbi:MAG TPA: acyltransferase family protein [Solirubrobacteraceae bacterium]|jgi:peptidoglycan/LPS O-acetylase OafA/YrhL|nr:acyltransferase family protein [Solirubrobacteraceae bacterium]
MATTSERTQPQGRPAGHRLRYRADIQGLRAVAVLAVIADHLAGWPTGSFVGVDVFFVISGYLITGILVREFESRQTISFLGFYARRIKRILPAGLFVIGATLCATRVLAGIDRYHFAAKDAIAAVLFIANWHFAQTGVNYFNRSLPPSPLQHYWSLSVEEQFYFVWPWLMLGLLVLGLRLRFWRGEHARPVAGAAITVVSVGSLWLAFAQTTSDPTIAYFSTFTRAWELGLGALVALCARPLARCDPRLRLAVALAGLAGVLASLFVVQSSPGFPAPWALLPTVSCAGVLAGGAGLTSRWLLPLTNPVSQYLGRISYSLYLWHFPVVVLIVTVVPQYSAPYWAGGLALIFGLSAASFHLLEDPVRRGTWFRRREGRLPIPALGWAKYTAACAATALLAGAGLLVVRSTEPTSLALPAPVLTGHTEDDLGDCLGAAALDPRHHCREVNLGDRVAPLPGLLPDDTAGAYACYAYLHQPMHPCVYGSRRPHAVRVALIGDSHAAALLAALEPQLDAVNWRVTVFVGQTCGWLPPALSPNCPGQSLIQRDLLHDHYAIVIATELRQYTSSVAEHLAAMRPVAATGTRIVVVEDDPSVSASSTACVGRITYSPTGGCGTPASFAYRHPDLLARAAERIPEAVVVPTRRFFCRGDSCPATIGNVIVYRDTAAHVTASYARTLSPYLVEAIGRGLHARAS